MNVFEMRNRLVDNYDSFIRSFVEIADKRLKDKVEESLGSGLLWPSPLIQLNPSFEPGATIDELGVPAVSTVDKTLFDRVCGGFVTCDIRNIPKRWGWYQKSFNLQRASN